MPGNRNHKRLQFFTGNGAVIKRRQNMYQSFLQEAFRLCQFFGCTFNSELEQALGSCIVLARLSVNDFVIHLTFCRVKGEH